MSNRISMAVQKAVDLWRENPNLTIAKAAELAGVHQSSLWRAINRLKLKRNK